LKGVDDFSRLKGEEGLIQKKKKDMWKIK